MSRNVEIRRPNLVEVGENCAIDTGFYLTTRATIGDFVHIGPYVSCIGGMEAKFTAKDFSAVAAGARLICLGDELLGKGLAGPTIRMEFRDATIGGEIILEKFAVVGTNAIIMPGLTLGEGSVVGAGSLLTKDTEPWTIYVGSPARPIKIRENSRMKRYAEELEGLGRVENI